MYDCLMDGLGQMAQLPVIVGFGGYNAAGRSSSHQGFRRMILESLDGDARQQTLAGLAVMTGMIKAQGDDFVSLDGQTLSLAEIETRYGAAVLDATLIRKIEKSYFDVDKTPWQQNLTVSAVGDQSHFLVSKKQLPQPVPTGWQVADYSSTHVQVTLVDNLEVKIPSLRDFPVKSAGQLPTGFEPAQLYDARFHPRGLQLTVVGMSDALHSLGIPWHTVRDSVKPDQIAVFAGSMLGQMDEYGYGGMIQARQKGDRVTAKQLPLGLNTMPADFINAYVLGSVGSTGSVTGACATFLYNLQRGIEAIGSGQARVVIVGNSEAPITLECIDGYGSMGALATEEGLRQIEGRDQVDFRRASRPFGENCGFTLAEAAQFVVLMDDALAMELGADIHGSVPDVFINADGFKKSISAPGPGNYLTMAKAVAAASQIAGSDAVRLRSFVHAHGSSTPANRVTESELLDRVAGAFGISDWPVAAVKAYVGHSLAPASGDQLISALGSFRYGLIPGIKTIDAVASDVHQQHLRISTRDQLRDADQLDLCFLNSKGFGGNNASAYVLAPHRVERMLRKRYGEQAFADYCRRREQTRAQAQAYDQQALHGELGILYNFGHDLIDDQAIAIGTDGIRVPGFEQPLRYRQDLRYRDMLD
jgi:acetoacetyl-[acyl-carrier protein] synthase